MGLVTGAVPSMVQGISQQAPELRLPTQGDAQVNGVSDPTFGLGKRAGTQHIKRIAGLDTTNGIWAAWVTRDDRERYCMVFDGASVRVFGLDGHEFHTDVDAGALNYLSTNSPRRDISSTTIGDTTLVLNRRFVVRMDPESATGPLVHQAVVSVKQGEYGQTYTIRVGGKTPSYTTSTTDVTTLRTSRIAKELSDAWDADAPSGFTKTYIDGNSHLVIEKADGSDFTIEAVDSMANAALSAVKNSVASFDELPIIAPDGYRCLVSGGDETATDDYWVQYSAADRLWSECVGPETETEFDASTLPHQITRLQDDVFGTVTGTPYGIYFRLSQVDWEPRVAGTTDSPRVPSFVGNAVSALVLHENRFGFLFKNRLVLSRTGDFFNFWRKSANRVHDDDTIDVTAAVGRLADDRVLDLRHGVSYNQGLLLIGDMAQVPVFSDSAITPSTIRMALATSLEASRDCRPIAAGDSLFIPYSDGALAGVREYRAGPSGQGAQTDTTTRHVPRLMPGTPWHMTACTSHPTLLVATDGSPYLYAYRWTTLNDQRVQAAWGVWDFGAPMLSFEIMGTTLWMLVARPEGPCMESLELPAMVRTEIGALYPVHLDRKTPCGTAELVGHVTPRVGSGGPTSSPGSLPGDGGGSGGGGSGGGGSGGGGGSTTPGGPESYGGGIGDIDGWGDFLHIADGVNYGLASGSVSTARDRAICAYDSGTDTTTIVVPWVVTPGRTALVRLDTMGSVHWEPTGFSNEMSVRGNVTALPLIIGNRFDFRYRFGPAVLMRPVPSGGTSVVRTGRLQVHSWNVVTSTSGPYDMVVHIRDRVSPRVKRVTPRRVGGQSTHLPRTFEGSTRVLARADRARVELSSTHFMPAWFVSAEWTGEYSRDDQTV